MDFYVGKEFEEDLSGVDDRKCMVSIQNDVNRDVLMHFSGVVWGCFLTRIPISMRLRTISMSKDT